MDDATKKGASDEEKTHKPDETQPKPEDELTTAEKEAKERTKSPLERRQEMLDEIAGKRNDEVNKSIAEGTPIAKEEEPEEIVEPEPKKKQAKAKKEESESEPEEEDELIIEGTKQKVPKSKIYDTGKRALQKELAADKKLEEASKRAKEIISAAEQEAQKLVTQRLSEKDEVLDAVKTSPDMDDPNFDKKVSDWVAKIQYGSEDEGKQALKEILTQGRGPTQAATPAVKEDEVIEKVEQRLVLKGIRQKFMASAEEGGFADLIEDPEIYAIARARIDKALTDGAPNVWETYQQIGESVRAKFVRKEDTITPEKTNTPKAASLEQRREKKRSIDTLRPASARTTTPETPATNPSAIIQAMREARGQR